jgi:hypothetical protein
MVFSLPKGPARSGKTAARRPDSAVLMLLTAIIGKTPGFHKQRPAAQNPRYLSLLEVF